MPKSRPVACLGLLHLIVTDTFVFLLCSAAHIAVKCFSMVFQLPESGAGQEPGLRRGSHGDRSTKRGLWG